MAGLSQMLNTEVQGAQVLHLGLQKAQQLVYTDPLLASKLALQLKDLAGNEEHQDEAYLAELKAVQGNVANQQLDFKAAIALLSEALSTLRDLQDHEACIRISADLAGPLLNDGQFSEAASLLDKAIQLASRDTAHLYRLRLREGFLQLQLGSPSEALACFAEARQASVQVLEELEDEDSISAYYLSLLQAGFAKVYTLDSQYALAIKAYKEVIRLSEQAGMTHRIGYHYLELGRTYMLAGEQEKASRLFEQCLQVEAESNRQAKAAALANLGFFSFQSEELEKAISYFDQAEHNYRTCGQRAQSDLSMIALWRARIARAKDQPEEASSYLASALELARQGEDRGHLAYVCQEIAEFQAAQSDFESAYQYQSLSQSIGKEVESQRNAQRIGELQLRHELEDRRKEAQMLQLKAARLQLKALKAQMNPHFIFNALNSIQESIQHQRASEASQFLAQFSTLMRQSLDYSERDVITLEEEIEFLRRYLDINAALRYSNPFHYQIDFDEELEEDLIQLPAMIVQPYIENALEHGIRMRPEGIITLSFAYDEADDNRLHICIEDNGIGRTASAKTRSKHKQGYTSMGTEITRSRLELLREGGAEAEVRYEDLFDTEGQARGTRVHLYIPIVWRS